MFGPLHNKPVLRLWPNSAQPVNIWFSNHQRLRPKTCTAIDTLTPDSTDLEVTISGRGLGPYSSKGTFEQSR